MVLFGGAFTSLRADVGVLVPSNVGAQPDPKLLSMERLDVTLRIDDEHATVRVLQVFHNRSKRELEGHYVFHRPVEASISSFAVWDDGKRIPGVVMEKRKARRIYEEITARKVDPGLLETDDAAHAPNRFSVKVFPIPPFGYKRLEMTYTERLPVSSGKSRFVFPLKPHHYRAQRVRRLRFDTRVSSARPYSSVQVHLGDRRLSLQERGAGEGIWTSLYDGTEEALEGDLTVDLVHRSGEDEIRFLTHRDAETRRLDTSPGGGQVYQEKRGWFEATLFLRPGVAATKELGRDLVILFDLSHSMRLEKLQQAFNAVLYVLGRMGEGDRFNLGVFDEELRFMATDWLSATAGERGRAESFLRSQRLSGATDLASALENATKWSTRHRGQGRAPFLLLFSDGHPTEGTMAYPDVLKGFDASRLTLPELRLMVLGIGADANGELLGRLAHGADGAYASLAEGEEPRFKLATFMDKLSQGLVKDLALEVEGSVGVEDVYPGNVEGAFRGSATVFLGRYGTALPEAKLAVVGQEASKAFRCEARVRFPERNLANEHLPRAWARARVDHLLGRIRMEGEQEDWINEIIRLAKQYTFVTPYTSFLAAPRALLRPRMIQPGDPVIRVKTHESVRRVTALLPFGEILPLEWLAREEVWEGRFLAPAWMKDGTYRCTLVLRDDEGRSQREAKSFVIDSEAPSLRLLELPTTLRRGEALRLRADASPDTRRITARLGEGPTVSLHWTPSAKASTGWIPVPQTLPQGRHVLRVTAEDFAHNLTVIEQPVTLTGF